MAAEQNFLRWVLIPFKLGFYNKYDIERSNSSLIFFFQIKKLQLKNKFFRKIKEIL